MDERREKYHAVNGQWPEVVPELTGPEAIAAGKRLYRAFSKHKRPWRGKWALTSGNRFTWPRGSTFYVNPARTGSGLETGWRDLVHMMSHYLHRELFPTRRPHDPRHHFLEKEMVAYIIKAGWLDGRLKAKPSKARPKPDRLALTLAAEKRWTTKLRRAQTALKKLTRQRARLARQSASQTVT